MEVGGAALRALRLEAKARLQISDWKPAQPTKPANKKASEVMDYSEAGYLAKILPGFLYYFMRGDRLVRHIGGKEAAITQVVNFPRDTFGTFEDSL